jgi:site-specific DNA-methyltransferase (adenine-specific)
MGHRGVRVAKPGAYLLAVRRHAAPYHRLAAAIEDAGWEIRDCLVWAYASGFPKSLNFPDGTGTALKPAWEPIVMARKPLVGTVAANRERYGTGALNIDATRIGTEQTETLMTVSTFTPQESDAYIGKKPNPPGRWPANVILTDPIFDGGVEGVVGGGDAPGGGSFDFSRYAEGASFALGREQSVSYGDTGTASRFFYIPKADRADREPVLRTLSEQPTGVGALRDGERQAQRRANVHPTVKPTDLMRHLIRLVTPPGGTVLDPFLGSGTTALAAELEGFPWLGIEREAEYVAIAEARLNGTQRGLGLSA